MKYFIDETNEEYASLQEIRWHIQCVTDSDKESYNGMNVYRTNDDKFYRVIKIIGNKVVLSKK